MQHVRGPHRIGAHLALDRIPGTFAERAELGRARAEHEKVEMLRLQSIEDRLRLGQIGHEMLGDKPRRFQRLEPIGAPARCHHSGSGCGQ